MTIKEEIAKREGLEVRQIHCYFCKFWGYNNGRVLTSGCKSRCLNKNQPANWTYNNEYCKRFEFNKEGD